MNEAQMLDKSSYKVATTPGAIYAPLGTDDTVTKVSDRSVLIDLSKTVDSPSVMLSPIMDLSGKSLYNSTMPVYTGYINEESVYVRSVDLISKNKVKITFNTELKTFANNDIYFSGVTDSAIRIAFIESMLVNNDGNTEIVMVLDKELSTDGTYKGFYIYAVTKAVTNSETYFGTKLSPSQTISIYDNVAPEVITYDHDSDDLTDPVEKVVLSGDILNSMVDGTVDKDTTGTITISHSEDINPYSISILTYVVDGYTVTDISSGVNNSELVLSIKANSDTTPARTTVRQIYKIGDYKGNIFLPDKAFIVR
jgi:hypothetical protein